MIKAGFPSCNASLRFILIATFLNGTKIILVLVCTMHSSILQFFVSLFVLFCFICLSFFLFYLNSKKKSFTTHYHQPISTLINQLFSLFFLSNVMTISNVQTIGNLQTLSNLTSRGTKKRHRFNADECLIASDCYNTIY